jgi:CheY-like chemotaxis protein
MAITEALLDIQDTLDRWRDLGSLCLRNGIELTRLVRSSGRFGNLPIVALTSLSTDEDVANARAAGVNEYLVKLDDSALLAAVRSLIGSAR